MDGCQILTPIVRGRRSYAHEHDVAGCDAGVHLVRDGEPACRDDTPGELLDAVLHHGRLSLTYQCQLGVIGVDAQHLVPITSQADRRYGAYVAKANYANIHR